MQRSGFRLAILLVSGALLLGACNLFHSTDDKAITANIQSKLFGDPVLKTRDVRVDSQNGIVTLSGSVGTGLEKAAVERIATQEDGVKNVVNLLSVASPSAAAAPDAGQSAETPAAPPQAAPATTPTEQAARQQPAPEKPRHAQHAPPVNAEDNASAQLQAYTNSITSSASASPDAAPAPAPASGVATPPPAPAPAPQAAAAPAPAPPAPAPPPAPRPQEHLTIPSGTVLTIRMIDNIDSSRNQPGEEFAASLDAPIVVGDRVLATRGADARVRLVNAKSAGHIEGQSELQLELINVTINGTSYPTQSGYYEQHGASRGTRSAETIGGGAVLGALIGGILGRGRGAAIGSAAGAGAGTAVQVSTKGQQVKVPAETKIDFTLKDSVTVAMNASS